MESLGIIPPERLSFLPKKYWQKHEFCFFIHDQIARLLVEYESAGVHADISVAFDNALIKMGRNPKDFDLIEFLKDKNLDNLYKRHLLGNLVLALTSDFCHFLYESLTCFEKRKFIVGYSLLRKPLKENLLFLCWLLGDTDDFIKRFEKNNYYTLNSQTKERRIQIYELARLKLPYEEAYDSEFIWDAINSKSSPMGLEPIWQRATHLITSQGDALRTEDYSLNLVFHDPGDDDLFEPIYERLPYLLMFSMQIILECYDNLRSVNENTYGHLLLTTVGTYECLFSKRKPHIGSMLNKELGVFMECIHCKNSLKITKMNGPQLYLTEHIKCQNCSQLSQLPLYWLFSKANLRIKKSPSSTG